MRTSLCAALIVGGLVLGAAPSGAVLVGATTPFLVIYAPAGDDLAVLFQSERVAGPDADLQRPDAPVALELPLLPSGDAGPAQGGPVFYDGASGVFISFQDRIAGELGGDRSVPAAVEHDALVAANFDGIDRIDVVFPHAPAIDAAASRRAPEPR